MDKLTRCISDDGTLFMIATDTTETISEAQRIHGTVGAASAALGRLLTAASMMGVMLKGEKDSLTLRINGGGPTGSVIAVSDSRGFVKGYICDGKINLPLNEKGKLDVAKAVGTDGYLTVIKDLGLKEPYIGQVPIVSGEIAEDITSYFAISEQTPTVCALGVLTNPKDNSIIKAGGFIIQLLPTAMDDTIDKVERCIKDIEPITNMLLKGKEPEQICKEVLSEFNLEVLDNSAPAYRCDCSKERVKGALISAGEEELKDMAKDEVTEVSCNFCDKVYRFKSEEIMKILAESKNK